MMWNFFFFFILETYHKYLIDYFIKRKKKKKEGYQKEKPCLQGNRWKEYFSGSERQKSFLGFFPLYNVVLLTTTMNNMNHELQTYQSIAQKDISMTVLKICPCLDSIQIQALLLHKMISLFANTLLSGIPYFIVYS